MGVATSRDRDGASIAVGDHVKVNNNRFKPAGESPENKEKEEWHTETVVKVSKDTVTYEVFPYQGTLAGKVEVDVPSNEVVKCK